MSVELSHLGLGTFPFSNVFSDVSQETATDIVNEYLRLGGNYIETAPIYPVNKVNLSEILRDLDRNQYILGTKCGLATENGSAIRSGEKGFLTEQVEKEIERLKLEKLDLVQTHITPTDVTPEELGENLTSLVEQGLTTTVGCSNISLPDLKRVCTTCNVSWVQLRLSVIHRFEYLEIADFCTENEISLNVFQVIERGQFKGGWNNARTSSDLRNSKQEYIGEADQIIRQWFSGLERFYPEGSCTLSHIPIAWALNQKAVGCTVVGATSVEQVKQNWMSASTTPSIEQLNFIDKSFAALENSIQNEQYRSLREVRGVERQK